PVCRRLADAGIRVSLFIDPDPAQLDAAVRIGAPAVELHTGAYADARGEQQARELSRIREAARHASGHGLIVHAGHGMNYQNVQPIAAIAEIVELNIGHAIVARSLIDGMARAVAEMKRLMVAGRGAGAGA
ncbi:MAG TPA: pyridoxine 5'-phosphate synthase, partial [Steroidobacteraceae bacterium]|nr:pyridoxine 5'-phosphate synthase [Steroidobacteraceae bacterium]